METRSPSNFARRPAAPMRGRRGFALMDAVIAGVLLSIGMVAVLSVGAQAITMQQRGEVDIRAASALDEILSTVLAEGPAAFVEIHPLSGRFESTSPYRDFSFSILVEQGGPGVPAFVRATIKHDSGRTYALETLIADRRGDEPEPNRVPYEPIDREARYAERQALRESQELQNQSQ